MPASPKAAPTEVHAMPAALLEPLELMGMKSLISPQNRLGEQTVWVPCRLARHSKKSELIRLTSAA